MIAKHIKGNSFKGIIEYNSREDKGHRIGGNIEAENNKELIGVFDDVCFARRTVKVKAYHLILSLDVKDREVSDKEFGELAEEFLSEMKFSNDEYGAPNFPYTIYRHTDAEHQHLHVIMSRVDFDGNTINDSHNFTRGMRVCKKLEIEHDLLDVRNRPVDGKAIITGKKRRATGKNQKERSKRVNGKDLIKNRKADVKNKLDRLLEKPITLREFMQRLKGWDISVIPRFNKAGALSGISFKDHTSDNIFKGSLLEWKASSIKQRLLSGTGNSSKGVFTKDVYLEVLHQLSKQGKRTEKQKEQGQENRKSSGLDQMF